MITHEIHNQLEASMELSHSDPCTDSLIPVETNTDLHRIQVNKERLENLGLDFKNEWETLDKFNIEWIEYMDKNKMPIDIIKSNKYSIQTWFEYLNVSIPRYRCCLCNKYRDIFKLNKQFLKPISTENGQVVEDNLRRNYDNIRRHYDSAYHKAIIQKLIEKTTQEMPETFSQTQLQRDEKDPTFKATSNLFRTVYTLLR